MKKLAILTILFSLSMSHGADVKKRRIKVAGVFPTSGPQSDFSCITKAIINNFNKKKMKIQLDVFDSANDVQQTLTQVQKIVQGGYDIVIGTRTSQEALSASLLFEQAKIPFLVPFASHPDITKNKKYVFRLIANSDHYAKLLSMFVYKELKPQSVVTINNLSSTYSQYYTDRFRELVQSQHKNIAVHNLDIIDGYNHYDELSAKIVSIAPQVIYAPVYVADMVQLLSILKDYPKPLTIISNASINDGRDVLQNINLASNIQVYFNGVWDEKIVGPYKNEFKQLLSKSCPQQSANLRTVTAFDLSKLLIKSLEDKPQLHGEAFIVNLKKQNFHGLLGDLRVDEAGETLRPLNMFKMKNHKIQFYRSFN